MSLYADYVRERTTDSILEVPHGFATYRYLNETQVYIMDIYVDDEFRKLGIAASMADVIADEARQKGCKEMIGTVAPKMKGSTASLRVLFSYGMTLLSASENLIVVKKDL